MLTQKLTDLFVERVRPPARGRIEYFDASFPGLALRVTSGGGKSWCAFYRFKGRLRRFTLGGYPAIKPAQARREAQAALERVRGGVDPAEEKRARRELRTPDADTFGAVADDYLERHVRANNRQSTFAEAKRDLERNIPGKWRNRPIASITRRDVIDLIDGLIERGAPIQANRTLARLRALFNWAMGKDRLAASPAARLSLPTQERARDRVLSDGEIRWLWKAADEIGWPFGPLTKLLLLTAQRRDEVAGMTWAEIDRAKKIWVIPRHRTKNDREHEVHLSATTLSVLDALPRFGDLVFTTTLETPVSVRRMRPALAAKNATGLRDLAEAMMPALGHLNEDARAWIEDKFKRDLTEKLRALTIDHVIEVASCIVRATSGTREMEIRTFGYDGNAGRDGRPRVLEPMGEAVQNLCLRLLHHVREAGGRLTGKRLYKAVELLCGFVPDVVPHNPSDRTLKRVKAEFDKWAKATPSTCDAALVQLLEMRLPVLDAADQQDVEKRALHSEKVGQYLRDKLEAAADYFLAFLGPTCGRSAHGLLVDAARRISDECTEEANTLRKTFGGPRKAKVQPRRTKNP